MSAPVPWGFPEPGDALLGEWLDGKSPANAHNRAYLARSTSAARSFIFRASAEAEGRYPPEYIRDCRHKALTNLRVGHRASRATFVEAERVFIAAMDGVVVQALAVWPPKGGIQ